MQLLSFSALEKVKKLIFCVILAISFLAISSFRILEISVVFPWLTCPIMLTIGFVNFKGTFSTSLSINLLINLLKFIVIFFLEKFFFKKKKRFLISMSVRSLFFSLILFFFFIFLNSFLVRILIISP